MKERVNDYEKALVINIILQSILRDQSMIRNIVFVFKRPQAYTRLRKR